jgi:hypothetical protein
MPYDAVNFGDLTGVEKCVGDPRKCCADVKRQHQGAFVAGIRRSNHRGEGVGETKGARLGSTPFLSQAWVERSTNTVTPKCRGASISTQVREATWLLATLKSQDIMVRMDGTGDRWHNGEWGRARSWRRRVQERRDHVTRVGERGKLKVFVSSSLSSCRCCIRDQ